MSAFVIIALATVAFPSTPYGPSDNTAWGRMLQQQCAAHHIQQWMPQGQKVDLISDFIDRLPPQTRSRAKRLAFAGEVCAAEQAGQSCEAIVGLHAMRWLGLLGQLSSFMCSRASCSEAAICESLAPRRARPSVR